MSGISNVGSSLFDYCNYLSLFVTAPCHLDVEQAVVYYYLPHGTLVLPEGGTCCCLWGREEDEQMIIFGVHLEHIY